MSTGAGDGPDFGARGRGRGALKQFIQENKPSSSSSFGGPRPAPRSASRPPQTTNNFLNNLEGGGGRNRGGGDRRGSRNDESSSNRAPNKVFVVHGGQFENTEGGLDGDSSLEDMMDEVFDLAYEQEDGILILDYHVMYLTRTHFFFFFKPSYLLPAEREKTNPL